MRNWKALLIASTLLLSPAIAHAQCQNGLLSNCPRAVNPQPTDGLYGWQFGQNPHSRFFPLSGFSYGPTTDLSPNPVTANGGSVATGLGARFGYQLNIATDAPCIGNGITDDTACIQTIVNSLSSSGGGTLIVGPKLYRIGTSSSLNIPSGVLLDCPKPLEGNNNPTEFLSLPYTFVSGPNPVSFAAGAGSVGCNFISSGMIGQNFAFNNSIRDELNIQAAFTGTGITTSGGNVSLENVFVGGFSVGINSTSYRIHLRDVNVDANQCVNTTGYGDNPYYDTVHCFNFMNAGTTQQVNTWTVSGAASNGGSLYRITVSGNSTKGNAITSLVPGDTVTILGVSGASSANGTWTVAAVGSNYVDLTGSTTSGVTPTGNTTNGNPIVYGLSSLADIGVGSTISGTGIPGATTVVGLWPDYNALIMSAEATQTNAATTLTIGDSSYVSGGTLTVDAGLRSGDGFTWSNGTGATCDDCFVIEHPIGYHATTGSFWTNLRNAFFDHVSLSTNASIVALLVDSNSRGNSWIGGFADESYAIAVINSSAFSDPNIISGLVMDPNGGPGSAGGAHYVSLDSGRIILNGDSGSTSGNALVANQASSMITLAGNDMKIGFLAQDNPTALAEITVGGAGTLKGGTYPFGGTENIPGAVVLGGAFSSCNPPQCSVTMGGKIVDSSIVTVTMINGNTLNVAGNVHNNILHATSSVAAYTINLPTVSTGQEIKFYFDQAVTTLSIGGGVSVGFPTSPAANSSHTCIATSTQWDCS